MFVHFVLVCSRLRCRSQVNELLYAGPLDVGLGGRFDCWGTSRGTWHLSPERCFRRIGQESKRKLHVVIQGDELEVVFSQCRRPRGDGRIPGAPILGFTPVEVVCIHPGKIETRNGEASLAHWGVSERKTDSGARLGPGRTWGRFCSSSLFRGAAGDWDGPSAFRRLVGGGGGSGSP